MSPRFVPRSETHIENKTDTIMYVFIFRMSNQFHIRDINKHVYTVKDDSVLLHHVIIFFRFENLPLRNGVNYIGELWLESRMFVYDLCERDIRWSCIERRCSKMISVRKPGNYIFEGHDTEMSNWQSTQWFRSDGSHDLYPTRNRPITNHNDVEILSIGQLLHKLCFDSTWSS